MILIPPRTSTSSATTSNCHNTTKKYTLQYNLVIPKLFTYNSPEIEQNCFQHG